MFFVFLHILHILKHLKRSNKYAMAYLLDLFNKYTINININKCTTSVRNKYRARRTKEE